MFFAELRVTLDNRVLSSCVLWEGGWDSRVTVQVRAFHFLVRLPDRLLGSSIRFLLWTILLTGANWYVFV